MVVPHGNIALAPARISSVSITGSNANFTVTINGSGFGRFPAALPLRGYSPYVLITDAAQQSTGAWGYTASGVVRFAPGDKAHPLTYNSWSSTRIVVSGLAATAGDALTVVVTSPGPNADRRATWGGDAPRAPGGTPHINIVTFSGAGENLEMTILGSGFGPPPAALPYTGDLRYIEVQDWARPCGGSPQLFAAGYRPWDGSAPDAVTLRVVSWTVGRILIDGFAGAYGATACGGGYRNTTADDWPDAMSVTVWNTRVQNARGGQASWGGPDVRAVGLVDHPNGKGYWITASDGTVRAFGSATSFGDLAGKHLGGAVAALGRTFDGRGYWLAEANGFVKGFGDASTSGAVHGNPITGTVVGVVGSPSSDSGFWVVTSTGAVQAHGSAHYFGSMAGHHLNKPIVSMAVTPGGKGYWLVASDGGIFTYGNAHFYGSTGSIHLKQPIDGMAAGPNGHGYWLVASDGGVFCYADSHFYGSLGALILNAAIVGMSSTPDGKGYWLVGADGGVFGLGDAHFFGAGL
jgi:hypothetical protein